MNRSEQEQLFRQSREVMIRAASSETLAGGGAFGGNGHGHGHAPAAPAAHGNGEDIVLSVLKSPLVLRQPNHRYRPSLSAAAGSSTFPEDDEIFDEGDGEELRRLKAPAAGEDDTEDTDPGLAGEEAGLPQRRFAFLEEQLRRFRGPRGPRFGEAHHKRVPTPIKKRRRKDALRHRSKSDDMEDEDDEIDDDEDDEAVDGVVDPALATKRGSGHRQPPGVPDPYYPIFLPIDQAFKAKYVFHHKKGKTFQERVYVFLEHPGGWLCFVYHFTV
ncbi:hypothetical protein R5R35_009377 [Gryllus longicercus]|uniref:Uncharacterized protein n=1 Tax=Gryllus longicercus TaxID=2509291 RepID=A0AAN9VB04_9ORTH